jgi:hypothetical protein
MAPQMTYAAPVAPAPQAMVIQQPQMTSRDMPDPNAIDQQKKSYAASLEQQLNQGKQAIMQENAGRKKLMNDAASQQKSMFILQVDQALKKDEMLSDQEMNVKILELERAAHEQRLALETQAANLIMEYNQKKTQEAYQMQNGMIVKAFDQAQMQIQSEAAKLQLPMAQQGQQQMVVAQPGMVAPQAVTYAAPPTTYAAPQATYGAPMTYAAPGASYAAAPQYAAYR